MYSSVYLHIPAANVLLPLVSEVNGEAIGEVKRSGFVFRMRALLKDDTFVLCLIVIEVPGPVGDRIISRRREIGERGRGIRSWTLIRRSDYALAFLLLMLQVPTWLLQESLNRRCYR